MWAWVSVKGVASAGFQELARTTPYARNAMPLVRTVVINEIMYNPANAGDEYIEIKNVGLIQAAPGVKRDDINVEVRNQHGGTVPELAPGKGVRTGQ
mgnify:CR=1 FL=1